MSADRREILIVGSASDDFHDWLDHAGFRSIQVASNPRTAASVLDRERPRPAVAVLNCEADEDCRSLLTQLRRQDVRVIIFGNRPGSRA